MEKQADGTGGGDGTAEATNRGSGIELDGEAHSDNIIVSSSVQLMDADGWHRK